MWSNFDKDNYDYFLIIDLEATCSDDGAVPRNEMETIEIGAVMVDGGSFQILGEFSQFIKPIIHPTLTDFCTTLTSITQNDVDTGVSYPEAVDKLKEFINHSADVGYNGLFCSWGAYDKNQFRQDSELHDILYPFSDEHLNLKTAFSLNQGRKKMYSMKKAMNLCKLPLIGMHHRGIDDARNMVQMMPFILGDSKI